jgi:ABC-type branched-subunit amino acid transport system substrate-binding protein
MYLAHFNNCRVFVVSVLLSIGLLLSSCETKVESGSDNSVENEKTTESGPAEIGAFILKSGSDEASAKSFEQGAQLATSSNPSTSFELKFFDASQGNTPEAVSLKTLVEKEKAPAALYWTVDDINPVVSYLNTSKTIGFVSGEVNEKVIAMGANIFGFGYSTELTFTQMAKFAGKTLKSYRFAVISASESRFDLQSRVFIEESKSLGNTIVFDQKVTADNADFDSLIDRAKKETCDTIFAVLPAADLVKFIKAVRTNKFNGKVLVGDTLFASELVALGQDAEGIYMAQAWSDDSNLKALYTEKYGNSVDGVTLGFAALGYDTVKCLQGIQEPLSSYTIAHSLLSTSCEGLTGKTQFTGERIAQRRKQILSVKNGQFMLAE